MKLLVFAIDAADPKILFDHLEQFPTFAQVAHQGSYAPLEGYCLGYGSYDNWATVYTGLPPRQHGIIDSSGHSAACPTIADIEGQAPLWDTLSAAGISNAWVRGLMMNPPPAVDGWVLGGDPEFLLQHTSSKYPTFHPKDAHLRRHLRGAIDRQPRPRLLEELGTTWDELRRHPERATDFVRGDYFAEFLDFSRSETRYYTENLIRLQAAEPTEFLFYYSGLLDVLQHFQMHEPGWQRVKEGYAILDAALERLIETLQPDNVLIVSDHGQEPFHMLFPDTPREVQEEAFGWSTRVFCEDGTILCQGRTGVLSAIHAMNGIAIFSGDDFAKGADIGGHRILDLHPTLLRLFDLEDEVAAGQHGQHGRPIPVFRSPDRNAVSVDPPPYEHIAVVQTLPVHQTLRRVNELYIRFRGARISVVGEARFRNTFLYDPRVSGFVDGSGLALDWEAYDQPVLRSLLREHPEFDLVVVPQETERGMRDLWI